MAAITSLDRLKSQLLTSGIQQQNPALFQVINQLIDFLRQSIDTLSGQIITIITPTPGGGGGVSTIQGFPAILDGLDGDEGPIGPQGPQGIQGIQGPIGPPGIDSQCCECLCLSFIGTSVIVPGTSFGGWQQINEGFTA